MGRDTCDAENSAMNNQLQQQLDTIVQKIVSSYQPEQIILFGSAARGRMDAGSDIDLFIVKSHRKPRHQRSTEVYDLLWDMNRPPLGRFGVYAGGGAATPCAW